MLIDPDGLLRCSHTAADPFVFYEGICRLLVHHAACAMRLGEPSIDRRPRRPLQIAESIPIRIAAARSLQRADWPSLPGCAHLRGLAMRGVPRCVCRRTLDDPANPQLERGARRVHHSRSMRDATTRRCSISCIAYRTSASGLSRVDTSATRVRWCTPSTPPDAASLGVQRMRLWFRFG